MAGFDGAVSRFEGSIKKLETAIGRAWDNDGKGGVLTSLMDWLAKSVQYLAETNGTVVQIASGVGILAGAWAGLKGITNIGALLTGGGLPASAVALTEAAGALNVAAIRLGAAGGGS